MSNQNDRIGAQGKEGNLAGKRRRRWPWVLLGILVILFVIVLLLPTFLSTGAGNRFLLGQVNKQIPGKISAESLSLGWFSTTKATQITISDPEGKPIVTVPRVDTQWSLLDLLRSRFHGDATVDIARADLVTYPDGSINIQRALGLKNEPPKPKGEGAARLDIVGHIKGTLGELTWASPNNPPLRVKDALLDTTVNTNSDDPTAFNTYASVGVGDKPPSRVEGDGTLRLFEKGYLRSVDQITGEGKGKIAGLDLSALQPILASMGYAIQLGGTLDGAWTFASPKPGTGELNGQFAIPTLTVSGDMFKGDTMRLTQVRMPTKLSWRERMITFEDVQLQSDLVKAKAEGTLTIEAIRALTDAKLKPPPSELTFSGTKDLAGLAKQLPHMMALQKGLALQSGSSQADGKLLVRDGAPVLTLTTQVRDVKGMANGREVTLEPIELAVETKRTPQMAFSPTVKLEMPVGEGQGPEKTLVLTAKPMVGEKIGLQGNFIYNLDRLYQQVSQFVDLKGKSFAGTGSGDLTLTKAGKGEEGYVFSLNTVSQNLTVKGVTEAPLSDPEIRTNAAGVMKFDPAFWMRLDNLVITGKTINVAVNKPLTIGTQEGQMVVEVEDIKAALDLATWSPTLAAMGYLPEKTQLRGNLTTQGLVKLMGGKLNVRNNTTIEGLQTVVAGNNNAGLHPTNFSANLNGEGDLNAKLFTSTDTCTVMERDPKSGAGTKAELPKGSKISWGQGNNDVTAKVDYDLARLSQLLAAYMPKGFVMAGQRSMSLHVTGPVTNEAGTQKLRSLRLEPTAFGFDSIKYHGLDCGKGQISLAMADGQLRLGPDKIPANGGHISLAGRVDMNRQIALFTLDQPMEFASNVQLNQELAAGPLSFLPMSWGLDTSKLGLLDVKGGLNLVVDSASLPLDFEELKRTGTMAGKLSLMKFSTNMPLFDTITKSIPGLKLGGGSSLMPEQNIDNVTFKLQNGKVHYDNLSMAYGSTGLTFSGDVGLDKTLAMNVTLNEKSLQVPIPIGLGGTTEKPQIKVTQQGLEKAVPGLIDKFLPGKKK